MTDQWDGWPADEPGDGDTADLGEPLDGGGFADDGLDPGFDPPGSEAPGSEAPGFGEFGAEPAAGEGEPAPLTDPIGYGEEPLDAPDDGEVGFGEAEPEPSGEAESEPGAAEPEPGGPAGADAEAGDGGPVADAPVGADPDLDPYGDEPAGGVFPEPLDLGAPPEPVDGFPWADADLLGDGDATPLPDPAAQVAPAPPAGELFAYAAQDVPPGDGGWAALLASPDPATATLARFWGTE